MTTPKLTEPMRTMLTAASHPQGLRRTPTTPWPHHPNTERALLNRGLIDQTVILNGQGQPIETWTITSEGRQALNPPRPDLHLVHQPKYLARPGRTTGDYTTRPHRAIDDLETVDAPPTTIREARQRHHAAQAGDGTLEQRLERARLQAERNGVNLTHLEKALEQRLRAIERAARNLSGRNAA